MPTFRDLWIWQESHKLMLEIHQFCKSLPKQEIYRIRDQIERSSSSVADNIAEGYSAYYFNEKIKGMYVARKEAGETQNHIQSLIGKRYLEGKRGGKWIEKYEKVKAGINSYINYIHTKKQRLIKNKKI